MRPAPVRPALTPVQAEWISTTEGFFSTLGVPLKAGRGFTKEDTTRTRTAILSEGFARQLFGSASPVGRQIGREERCTTS